MNQVQFDRAKQIALELRGVNDELATWKRLLAERNKFPVYVSIGAEDSVTFDKIEFEGIGSMCEFRLEARAKELQAEFEKL